jgi:hypothetical protein
MGSGQGTPVSPPTFANVNISEWYNYIWPNVPMCPNPKIKEALIDAARKFCKATELWTKRITDIDIVDGEPEYTVASYDGDFVSVDHFEILGDTNYERRTVISEIAISENPDEREDWRYQEDNPDAGWVGSSFQLRLTYVPEEDITAGLRVWLNVMPFDSATVFPAFLWTHYREVITSGALSSLLMMANKPWSNPDLGSAHGSGFQSEILPARQKKFSGFVRHRTRDIITTKYTDF